jgi:hypothetical protein
MVRLVCQPFSMDQIVIVGITRSGNSICRFETSLSLEGREALGELKNHILMNYITPTLDYGVPSCS